MYEVVMFQSTNGQKYDSPEGARDGDIAQADQELFNALHDWVDDLNLEDADDRVDAIVLAILDRRVAIEAEFERREKAAVAAEQQYQVIKKREPAKAEPDQTGSARI